MNFNKLENLMNSFVEKGYAPGNTMMVYLNGEKVFDYSCGYSDLENKILMNGNEYFNIYSCSKIATVVAALQLLEKGVFLLDDPLYEYIPEYKEMYVKGADGELRKAKNPITIHNLFTMTAGLTYDSDTVAFEKARNITNGKMNTDIVARCIAEDPLAFEPGERFEYSLCHDVLAGLVSIITGKKFRDYMKENIFDPLEMDCSMYHLMPGIRNQMAQQYCLINNESDVEKDGVKAQIHGKTQGGHFKNAGIGNKLVFGEEYDSGGAGIITKVSDYIKLAVALANNGTGMTGERILSPYTIDLMKTNALTAEQMKYFNWKPLKGYGYGLGVRTMLHKEKGGVIGNCGEFGWSGAAGSSVYIDPQTSLAAMYAKHTLNPREDYYQPRIRNVVYACIE